MLWVGITCPACAGCSCSVTGLWAQLSATPGPLVGGGHVPCSLPVLALNQGPRSPGSHPAAPAAAGVSGLSQLPSPAPRSSSCPRFPLCPALQGLVGSCTPSWGCRHEPVVWELFQRLDPSPNHGDDSRGCILHPQPRAVGTRLLHGDVSPSQPGSSTQHPMAQPVPGALPAPAPNPPWSLLLLHGRGGSLRGSPAPSTAPTLPPFFPAGTALAGFPSRCS